MSELIKEIETRARWVYEQILDPIARRFEFEESPPASETSALPMVLFLGNHSSGKSSFINYLANADLQRTGVAPIDDGFTIITHGAQRADVDGPSVVTHPKLPWRDLQNFGEVLVNHLKMAYRPSPMLEGIALVDSPGMIDMADGRVNRGYDFQGVVRWFAERADVILLLFDPDKPGTTGETLQILTTSLAGLDHKLLLVFNKVDRCDSMRDYARTYGALCWNLAKVIPRKDLPHIFNTFLPNVGSPGESKLPLGDFGKQLEEVREEIKRAPFRRVDNVISRLNQHASRLRVYVRVADRLAWDRLLMDLRYVGIALALLSFGGLMGYLGVRLFDDSQGKVVLWTVFLTVLSMAALVGVRVWEGRIRLKQLSLDTLFERAFSRELTRKEADQVRGLWGSVREHLDKTVRAERRVPRLRRGELRALSKVVDAQIPELRALAAKRLKEQGEEALRPEASAQVGPEEL